MVVTSAWMVWVVGCGEAPEGPSCEDRIAAFVAVADGVVALAGRGVDVPRPHPPEALPALDLPLHDPDLGIYVVMDATGRIVVDGAALGTASDPAVWDRLAAWLVAHRTRWEAQASGAPEMPPVGAILEVEAPAPAAAVGRILQHLQQDGIAAVDVLVMRDPQPGVDRVALPDGFEGYEAATRSPPETRVAQLQPYWDRIEASLYANAACPVDVAAVRGVPEAHRLQQLVDTWTAGARGCDCAVDMTLLSWHLQEFYLPRVFLNAVPLTLVGDQTLPEDRTWGQLLISLQRDLAAARRGDPGGRLPWPRP